MTAIDGSAAPATASGPTPLRDPVIEIRGLEKTYANGFQALGGVDLTIRRGEILALLGPNGAGKTTLISIVCGLVTKTGGTVTVAGADIVDDYRTTRSLIGLVPQELSTDAFETVWSTVRFSRGLFGLPPDEARLEAILADLSLSDKRDEKIMTLSGGMKRRVMIAKALAHEPRILFLDEPTAGVDVSLRKGMWQAVRALQAEGVTIILTTHYIEEAEEMADRVAIINEGRILEVDETAALMRRLGKKRIEIALATPLAVPPAGLEGLEVTLEEQGARLVCVYDPNATPDAAQRLLTALTADGVAIRDLSTAESTLEEIFVSLVEAGESGGGASASAADAPASSRRERQEAASEEAASEEAAS